MEQHNFPSSRSQSIEISRSDRWQVYQRLRELNIASTCLQDGSFQVEVYSPITVVQLHSVLSQFTAPRPQLLNWLERCLQQ